MKLNKSRRKSRRAKRGIYISSKSTQPVKYRSSWELFFAKWMDENNSIVSYVYEPYAIEYVSNVHTGRTRNYWPDFEVTRDDGTRILVEIKPKRKINTRINIKKRVAAEGFCRSQNMQYMILCELELKALGLVL